MAQKGFCHPQPYHIIPPSCNRYRKCYEVPDLRNWCNLSHPPGINNFEFSTGCVILSRSEESHALGYEILRCGSE